MRMKNRVALVTGGSRGIGASVARKLAAEGAKVAVVYKENRAAADEVAQGIRAKGGEADTFQGNVTDEHAVKAMVQEVVARFGKIDVLINAAGVFEAAALGEISRQLFQNEFLTHAWSVIAVTQAALPHFPKTGGHIVNVSTSLVHEPSNGTAIYSAAKGAVEVLTRGFALELGARGIRVNAVAPHITRTDMTSGIPEHVLKSEASLTPLARLAEPEDVSDVVAFLASSDARWITGRTILTDGGRM
jgi:3-oxoacyl-[acyl-carrier protein] reductase